MNSLLKGDDFYNRYRITGTLKTISPMHIGTGEESDALYSPEERARLLTHLPAVPKISTILRDHLGKPLIPGSTLRGVMRHWLLDVLKGLNSRWANERNYAESGLFEISQEEQVKNVRSQFSYLELLFGTPFNPGKLEVWDATCQTESVVNNGYLPNWNGTRLTYTDTSVAIDPTTGTAQDRFLYRTELVPPGVEFELNVVATNLSDEELGLLLFTLQGFNSRIYPIQLGADSARGHGRVQFTPGKIHSLDKKNLRCWVAESMQNLGFNGTEGTEKEAGYFALPALSKEQCAALIAGVKEKLRSQVGEQAGN